MSYKAYIQELADSEDRHNMSRLSTSTKNNGSRSKCLVSYGNIILGSSSTTSMPGKSTKSVKKGRSMSNLSLTTNSQPSRLTSSSLRTSSSSSSVANSESEENNCKVSMSEMDRIYKDNMARKQRSMVNLTELNKKLGLQYVVPPQPSKAPDTVYENLSKVDSRATIVSPAPSTFNCSNPEFARVIGTASAKDKDKNVELLIRVAECFD